MERGSTRRRSRRWLKRTWEQISSPQAQLSHWLGQVETRFSAELARGLKQWRLLPSEWEALRQMYRPGRTSPLALAQAIGMTKGGTSKLIARLMKKGLVIKEIAPFDGRGRAVGLTRAGKRLVPRLASLAEATEREFFSVLQQDGRRGCMDALKRVLGEEQKRYLDIWVSSTGAGGQWAYERVLWRIPGS
jgi:MarR family transcriptional regulator, lower aerobic nicotinate degradation pathway regulator